VSGGKGAWELAARLTDKRVTCPPVCTVEEGAATTRAVVGLVETFLPCLVSFLALGLLGVSYLLGTSSALAVAGVEFLESLLTGCSRSPPSPSAFLFLVLFLFCVALSSQTQKKNE
jgi:hypothetical protein